MQQGWILSSSDFNAIQQVLRSGGKLYDIMNKRQTLRYKTYTIRAKFHITDYSFLYFVQPIFRDKMATSKYFAGIMEKGADCIHRTWCTILLKV